MRLFAWMFLAFAGWVSAQAPAAWNEPAVQAALEAVRRNEPKMLDLQVRLSELPAPAFQEAARGREVARLFESLGLTEVRTDRVGNVIGVRKGRAARPNTVLCAHLDTVFPEGTNVKVAREPGQLRGPGIHDNARGLAVLVGVIEALREAAVETPGSITFVADVGEEGLGDLRGVKALFGETLKGGIDSFVSIDGGGSSIVNTAVGSVRYKVTFRGPGGHSYGAFGMANPIQAMGRAIAKIDAIEPPATPKTTFNVGRVGGGTSVNSIPFEAWMEVDLRSSSRTALAALDAQVLAAVRQGVEEENRRWRNHGPVRFEAARVGLRPAGATAPGSAIVRFARAASVAAGMQGELVESSTDSNIPMDLGIPAVTVGGGGVGYGSHSLEERFETADSWRGTARALLLVVALAR